MDPATLISTASNFQPLSFLPAAFQMYQGLRQQRQARKINPVRPVYQMPGEVSQATALARNSAYAPMPGMGAAQNNLRAATASGVRAASQTGSANNALATIAAMQGNEANGMNNLASTQAQFQNQNMARLGTQLNHQAQYSDKMFTYNKDEPYRNAAATKAALTNAGAQNVNGGLSGMASALSLGGKKESTPQFQLPDLGNPMEGRSTPINMSGVNNGSDWLSNQFWQMQRSAHGASPRF